MIMLNTIYDVLWIFVSLIFIILGLYFTFKLCMIQFNIKRILKSLFLNTNSFSGLMLSLGGRVGVGSIAGVALAIYIGGIGALFWLFLINLLSMPLIYSEVYLGVKYKKNAYVGPANYISNNNVGIIYSLLVIICYIFGFVSIQANTIVTALVNSININTYVIGIILSFIVFVIIFNGTNMISGLLNKIVPFMGILYIFIALFVFIKNISLIPNILRLVIINAFNIKSFISGFLIGIRRGIFASEIGVGTSSMASSISDNVDAKDCGYVQLLGIYITIFLICGSSAIIILTSNYNFLNIIDPNGIEIALNAFIYHFGNFGNIILLIFIILFAFSTILSNYYYGEVSIKYIFGNNYMCINLLKVVTFMVIFLGSINSSTFLWMSADIFIALLSIINIYAIYKRRNKIKT